MIEVPPAGVYPRVYGKAPDLAIYLALVFELGGNLAVASAGLAARLHAGDDPRGRPAEESFDEVDVVRTGPTQEELLGTVPRLAFAGP